MKLTAAEDQWRTYRDANPEDSDREFHRAQAVKHGQDVCRAVAMMRARELYESGEVVAQIRETPAFKKAAVLNGEFFGGDPSWARDYLSHYWEEQDLNQILEQLVNWFQ